jgi:hypothetical protein
LTPTNTESLALSFAETNIEIQAAGAIPKSYRFARLMPGLLTSFDSPNGGLEGMSPGSALGNQYEFVRNSTLRM